MHLENKTGHTKSGILHLNRRENGLIFPATMRFALAGDSCLTLYEASV